MIRNSKIATALVGALLMVGALIAPAQASIDEFFKPTEGIEYASMVSDVGGNAIDVSDSWDSAGNRSVTFRYRRAAGHWSAAYTLFKGNHPWRLAAGRAGSGLVVWTTSTGTYVRTRLITGAWASAHRVASGATSIARYGTGTAAAVNADGDMAVTWFRPAAGGKLDTYVAVKLRGGQWRTSLVGPIYLEPDDVLGRDTGGDTISDLAIDATGNVSVARNYASGQVIVKTRKVGGTWTTPVQMGPNELYGSDFDLQVDPQGRLSALISDQGCMNGSPPTCTFQREVLVHQDQPGGALRTLVDSSEQAYRNFSVASGGRLQLVSRSDFGDRTKDTITTQQLAPSVGPQLSVPSPCSFRRADIVTDANGVGWMVNCDRLVRITPTALAEQPLSIPNNPYPVYRADNLVFGPNGDALLFLDDQPGLSNEGIARVSP